MTSRIRSAPARWLGRVLTGVLSAVGGGALAAPPAPEAYPAIPTLPSLRAQATPATPTTPPAKSVAPAATPAPMTKPMSTAPAAPVPATVAPATPVPDPITTAPVLSVTDSGPMTYVAGGCNAGCGRVRCRHCSGSCWAILCSVWGCCKTEATVVPPQGTAVNTIYDMQRQNALPEYFVLFREEFNRNEAGLNDSGVRHLDGIIRRMSMTPAPIKVEPTGKPGLDELRRQAVIEALVVTGVDAKSAVSRVQIGSSRAEGLRYEEVDRTGLLFLSGVRTNMGGGFGGMGGGFGGGGYGR